MKVRSLSPVFIFFSTVFALSIQANAAPLYWSPGTNPNAGGGGSWATAGNWSTTPGSLKTPSSSVPTNSDDVFLGGGGGVLTTTGDIFANSFRVDASGYSLSHSAANRIFLLNNFVQTDELSSFVFTHTRTSAAAWVLDVTGNTAFNGVFRNNTTGNHALSLTLQGGGTLNLKNADFQNTGNTSILSGKMIVSGASTGLGVIPSTGLLQIGQANANNTAILEIDGGGSASSFTRSLGTAAGQVRLGSTATSEVNAAAGFSAVNGDLTVNFGGNNSIFSWTTNAGTVRVDTLVLGSDTATHRTILTNPINFGNLATDRTVRVGNGAATIDAEITGAISATSADRVLNKTGEGTLLLSGTSSSFAGRLNIAEGFVLINGAITSATNNAAYGVNVAAGASLGGSGTITLTNAAASTIISGSLSPGNSIGTLTINSNVTWNYNAGSDWVFELGAPGGSILAPGTSDHLTISGDFIKGTGTDFIFDFAGGGAAGWYQLISWTGTSSFTANDFIATNLGNSLEGTFLMESDGLYLNVSVIPEPGTVVLACMGLMVVILRKKSRNQRLGYE